MADPYPLVKSNGRLVLVRDTSIASIRQRQGTRALTPEEFAEFMAEHGPHMQPPDDIRANTQTLARKGPLFDRALIFLVLALLVELTGRVVQ